MVVKGHGKRRREMMRRGLMSAALMHHEDFIDGRQVSCLNNINDATDVD